MRIIRKVHIKYILLTLVPVILLALTILMPTTSLGQTDEAQIILNTALPDGPVADALPVETFEIDIVFDYKIPSQEEIAKITAEAHQSEKFKVIEKQLGKEKAEQTLTKEIKEEIEYLKDKNKIGKEKFPIIKVGDNSAYFSPWTLHRTTWTNMCTTERKDPMTMFFFSSGDWFNTAWHLANHGWRGGAGGADQCTWVSSFPPAPEQVVSLLKPQQLQMENGDGIYSSRFHMRLWDGVYSGGAEGHWSVGSAHFEIWTNDPTTGLPNHCLDPAATYPWTSWGIAKSRVIIDLGYLPRWVWQDPNNRGNYSSCGRQIYNDGSMIGFQLYPL